MYYGFKHHFVILNNITKLAAAKEVTYKKRMKLTEWEVKRTNQLLNGKGRKSVKNKIREKSEPHIFV